MASPSGSEDALLTELGPALARTSIPAAAELNVKADVTDRYRNRSNEHGAEGARTARTASPHKILIQDTCVPKARVVCLAQLAWERQGT